MAYKTNFFQQPLNWILSAQSSVAVIRALKDSKEGMSGRAVARASGFTHQACREALVKLDAVGFIVRQGSGKTQLVRLNFEHSLVKDAFLPLFRTEKQFTRSIRDAIRKEFKGYARSATLFGSVARKEGKPGSDVDLLLISDGRNKLYLSNKARAFEQQFILQYGIRLSPMVFSIRNARARYRKSDPLFENILSQGIDLLKERLRDIII
ncbi:MAG: nucleotidyltransferase domain-containing protein [Elusimicrobiota bacterium]|nr:nucleotidyltransferase domain-containing protein [Elusimicrobiota bacterium]